MRALALLFAFVLSFSLMAENTVSTLKLQMSEAAALYDAGDMTAAAEKYEAIALEYTGRSLEFNLGNCYYRSGKTAKAILHYERALRYAPTDADVLHNLALARLLTVDKLPTASGQRFGDWWQSILLGVGLDSWAILSILFALSVAASMGLYFFGQKASRQRLGGWLAFSALLLTGICLWCSIAALSAIEDESEAIIMKPRVQVMSAPNSSSTEIVILHEGTKIEIVRTSDEWCEIRLPDGTEGWISLKGVNII